MVRVWSSSITRRYLALTSMLVSGIVAAAACDAGVGVAQATSAAKRLLGAEGIAAVGFGTPRAEATKELERLFGRPTVTGFDAACGPAWTEVEWGDLAAEFHNGAFTGYRYLLGGYRLTASQKRVSGLRPWLATGRGVTLDSTVAEVRAAYAPLHLVGAEKLAASNGIEFVTQSRYSPPGPHGLVYEIKVDVCADQ